MVIGAAWFQSTQTPLHINKHYPPPHPKPVALPLVFTHAFPEVAMSPGFADGNVPSSSVFIGCGKHGKKAGHPLRSHPWLSSRKPA